MKDSIRNHWKQAGHKLGNRARLALMNGERSRKAKVAKLLARTLSLRTGHTSLREAGII